MRASLPRNVSGTIFINGKFTLQRTTGVQRVAEQLLRALDALPPLPGEPGWVLLHPPGGGLAGLGRIVQATAGSGGVRRLHAWEQWTLPRAARGELLLSLSGSAPFLAGRQAVLIHDAAVFDHPEAYTRPFVTWYRMLFQRLSRRAERLFTVSAFSQQRLAVGLGVPQTRFLVLGNGADHLGSVVADETLLDRHGLRGRRFLLTVGSANPTKNVGALVDAFARLARPDLALVIVGGDNARVFAGRAALAEPPGVLRTGPLGDTSLKALYRHAAGFVFPSTYEGFGLPPLEAMAEGCPVAVADAASLPEVCGDAALYFDPTSAPAIDDALHRLLDDAALRSRLKRAGAARAAAFSWAASAARLRVALMEPASR